jgi:hypothetical protein
MFNTQFRAVFYVGLLVFAYCAGVPATSGETVIHSLVEGLQTNPQYAADTCILHLLESALDDKAVLQQQQGVYSARKIWLLDSTKTGIRVTITADPSDTLLFWYFVLQFPDTDQPKLHILEKYLGPSIFPEWSRRTKETHISIFNTYPSILPPKLYIAGERARIDSNGTVRLKTLEIRAGR